LWRLVVAVVAFNGLVVTVARVVALVKRLPVRLVEKLSRVKAMTVV